MPLNRKITFIILTIFSLSALAVVVIQRALIMPSFLDLERQFATQNTERVVKAVSRELEQVIPSVSDWAQWTDTYEYAKGQAPDYEILSQHDCDIIQGYLASPAVPPDEFESRFLGPVAKTFGSRPNSG